ncbi:hypothetical protein GEV33_003451 [Tenebrio molitor]|uniref:Uncharacterized protein n=1 Tax=Tenebrio molitor TaxID=7067 RepID=A0A8J6HIF2_TENMO|nr:hypothetical protein GEV33_003451 [Tenebrio molitor]
MRLRRLRTDWQRLNPQQQVLHHHPGDHRLENTETCIWHLVDVTKTHMLLLGSTPKDFYKGRILIPVLLKDWTSGYWKPETFFLADLGIVDIQDLCELLTILTIIEEAPGRSTRSIAEELGLNRRHVWDVIHDEKHQPHHYTKVYSLQPQDLGARVFQVVLCGWMKQTSPEMECSISITNISTVWKIPT